MSYSHSIARTWACSSYRRNFQQLASFLYNSICPFSNRKYYNIDKRLENLEYHSLRYYQFIIVYNKSYQRDTITHIFVAQNYTFSITKKTISSICAEISKTTNRNELLRAKSRKMLSYLVYKYNWLIWSGVLIFAKSERNFSNFFVILIATVFKKVVVFDHLDIHADFGLLFCYRTYFLYSSWQRLLN